MTVAKDRLKTQRMTLQEYLEYDDGTNTPYELEDGILIEMTDEVAINKTIVTLLIVCFSQMGVSYRRMAAGHEIEVVSNYATARKPDLIVHSEASESAIFDDTRLLRLGMPAPALVVEVVSNSQKDKRSRDRDYVRKRQEYAERGIAEYWIIDPEAAVVLVLTLVEGVYQEKRFVDAEKLASPMFPALELTALQVLTANL